MLEENALRAIIASARDGIVVTRKQGSENPIIYANPAFAALTGYTQSEIIGRDCRFLQGEDFHQDAVRELSAAIRAGQPCQVVLRNYRKNGTPFWNELSVSPIASQDSDNQLFLGIQKDVTKRVELSRRLEAANKRLKQINEKLEEENKVDALTGIFNRRVLDREVHMLWRTAMRIGGNFAFIFIDLDDFKQINDQHGHDVGDACLIHVAEQLHQKFRRESDVVLRMGGEEFLIASFGADEHKAVKLANQVVERIANRPCHVLDQGLTLNLRVSVGVAVTVPNSESDLDDLICEADEAMFEAKKRGKNQAVLAGSTSITEA